MCEDGMISSSDFVSVVSDTDEIYDKEKICEVIKNYQKHIRPLFRYHYYSLDITRPKNTNWTPQKRLKIMQVSEFSIYNMNEVSNSKMVDEKIWDGIYVILEVSNL